MNESWNIAQAAEFRSFGLAEAAKLLGISSETCSRLTRAGVIRGCKVGRAWVYLPACIEDARHALAPIPKNLREAAEKVGGKRIRDRLRIEKRATPPWADLVAIRLKYVEARRLTSETGVRHSVDHEVPLCGKTVSGLHVAQNLRIITLAENVQKNNRWSDG